MAGSDTQSSVAGRRNKLVIGGWRVHPDRCTLVPEASAAEKRDATRLSPRCMDVLLYLVAHRDEVVSTRELLDAFWERASASDHAVHNAIASLRSAFGDDPHAPEFIRTLPKRGYQLMAPVNQAPASGRARRDARPLVAALVTSLVLLTVGLGTLTWVQGSGPAVIAGLRNTDEVLVLRPATDDLVDNRTRRQVNIVLDALVEELARQPQRTVLLAESSPRDHRRSRARYVLDSRLYATEGAPRLTLHLMDESRGYTLYLDHFALQRSRLPESTERIVSEIRTALEVHLDPERRQRMLALGTADALAFHHFLRAEALRSATDKPSREQALVQYEASIARDNRFVRAYIGKAATARALARQSEEPRARILQQMILELGRRLALAVPDSDALAQLREMRSTAITDTAPRSGGLGPGPPGSDG